MVPTGFLGVRARRRAGAAVFAYGLSALLLVACGDGNGDGSSTCKTGEICVEDNPRLVLDPPDLLRTVVESGQPAGSESIVTVTVENSGTGPLRLNSVTIEYTPPAGGTDDLGAAFERLPAGC
jgi:hypothetical protein